MTDLLKDRVPGGNSGSEREGFAASRPQRRPRAGADAGFVHSILAGLNAKQKRIESKWLYDVRGSQLFDQITDLAEYYPTRTETAILRARARDLMRFSPDGTVLVELGSGSSVKTRLLLDALATITDYVPVDISAEHLHQSARRLSADYGGIDIHPLVADFTAPLTLPETYVKAPKLVFFPGSTIGNFEIAKAVALMRQVRRIENVSAFVVGVDQVKDEQTLVRAYDDSRGVTAAFNLNLLTRINRELGANFDVGGFRHEARWNREQSRIEMHLVSVRDQNVQILERRISFREGETIHTENSHKYNQKRFARLAGDAGWRVRETWLDEKKLFGVAVLTPVF